MKAAILSHANDADWLASLETADASSGSMGEDDFERFLFQALPAKWHLMFNNADLQTKTLKMLGSQRDIDPCQTILVSLERIPALSASLPSSFKEFLFAAVKATALDRFTTVIMHCASKGFAATHPPLRPTVRGMFRVQEVLTNYLQYCPKPLVDPCYFSGIYDAFFDQLVQGAEAELVREVLDASLVNNKTKYMFAALFAHWTPVLSEALSKLLATVAVDCDSMILKLVEYFHETSSCGPASALSVLGMFAGPKSLDLLTIRRLAETRHFGIREAKLVVSFFRLLAQTRGSAAKVIFTVCCEVWGAQSFAAIAGIGQHKCKILFEVLLI